MPKARIAMHDIHEILRLRHECGRSQREIARSRELSVGAVCKVLRRAREAGLCWPLPEGLEGKALEERLYGGPRGPAPGRRREGLDFAAASKDLSRRKNLTLRQLWLEYCERSPGGYSYSRYCELYRQWKAGRDTVMLQEHRAGEKLFLDYAGQTVPVQGREEFEAQVFVAVLGASSYFYAEASRGQDLKSWIGSNVRALEHFGGSTALLVPDNLKAAVTRAGRYEPQVNRTYGEMARHYGAAVVPARPHRPKDKAKAEACVQLVERSLLEALRHRRFASLGELNEAIRAGSAEINARPFQKRPESRKQLFEELDRPALRPLPAGRYEYAEWRKVSVGADYHVEVDGHRYSVPHALARRKAEARLTEAAVEVLRDGQRVALHARSRERGGATTDPDHRPRAHREQARWTPESVRQWAAGVGPGSGRRRGAWSGPCWTRASTRRSGCAAAWA